LISRASGTARSGKFVRRNWFQIKPAPSSDCTIPGALIAGARSAPRCTLRVITVIVDPVFAPAGIASASIASATNRSANLAPRRGSETFE
jgi:hypothetical protein